MKPLTNMFPVAVRVCFSVPEALDNETSLRDAHIY